jgi:hypothetical protein
MNRPRNPKGRAISAVRGRVGVVSAVRGRVRVGVEVRVRVRVRINHTASST